jgi:hypothetical protein
MNDASKERRSPVGRGWRPGESSSPDAKPVPPTVDARFDGAPPDPVTANVFVGVARAVHERSEGTSNPPRIVWTFRLERYDQAGNRLQPIPVEMRGRSFEGAISDGDTVEVRGRWHQGTTLRPQRAANLTTGAVVATKGYGKAWIPLAVLFVVGLVLLAILLIIGIHETNLPRHIGQAATMVRSL